MVTSRTRIVYTKQICSFHKYVGFSQSNFWMQGSLESKVSHLQTQVILDGTLHHSTTIVQCTKYEVGVFFVSLIFLVHVSCLLCRWRGPTLMPKCSSADLSIALSNCGISEISRTMSSTRRYGRGFCFMHKEDSFFVFLFFVFSSLSCFS